MQRSNQTSVEFAGRAEPCQGGICPNPASRVSRQGRFWVGVLAAVAVIHSVPASTAPSDYFGIHVIDESTGRGVPLVELTTVNNISCWTDSGGLVAFLEPGLMGQEVFFHVRSHGYEYPKDGFSFRGVKLRPVAGGRATVKLKRLNIAERLYRVTGAGNYRDTVLLGMRPPIREPLLNAEVTGQDTVVATQYRGKTYWFWGDTGRASYPLGNFGASGATSDLPGRGGLDPSIGVDFTYFTNANGFSRPMCPDSEFGPGLKWIEGVMTVRDEQDRERLIARVAAGTGLERTREWHVAMFNDTREVFESVVRWDNHDTHDSAHPFRHKDEGVEYLYLYPNFRVRADFGSVTNPAAYQSYTCLKPGTRFEGNASKIHRAPDGRIRYEWQTGAGRLSGPQLRDLINAGLLKPEESRPFLRDVETGNPVPADRGSVCWNEFRRRWIMIASGLPGEIWVSEAPEPVGPWSGARRIVTHDNYNFYNPTQHPFFDQDGGRTIYFEATYTASFSGAKSKTPRYDYNQIMYRLRLDDPRLELPAR